MDRNHPTPEQLVEMLIEHLHAVGATAWWDGEVVRASFGEGPEVHLTINIGRDNLRDLVDKGLGPL